MSEAQVLETKVAGEWEKRLRLKTMEVCDILSCTDTTLRNWEKVCPELFSPVLRQKNGNIYRPKQVRIMADVMDYLIDAETGAALWKRTQAVNTNEIYRDAGDKTRGTQ